MALAFLRNRPFVASTIIGATTLQQCRKICTGIELDAELLKSIEDIHLRYPNPAP